ncbi:MAG TPA: M20 family metallopeptidase [Thermoanaerobaculia bacterium]|nr:M20 family metallopeptidase [Thermoanaerobaculia bacterium]
MNPQKTRETVDRFWDETALPTLERYIEIPNLSPLFDPEWRKTGHMMRAVALLADWARQQNLRGASIEVLEPEGKTPLILIEVAGKAPGTIFLYGHLDKQPEMIGWDEGLGPWMPVRRGDRLYGRGAADDGYSIFGVVGAIKALQEQNVDHPRLVAMIESTEESGSFDLPWYVDYLKDRIGTPDLIVCLDSGCGNYDQMWLTNSLRGVITGNLRVRILKEGIHSGDGGGVIASSFRILRTLLDRLEDADTGTVKPQWMYVDVPDQVMEGVRRSAKILGDDIWSKFPFVDGAQPMSKDPIELVLNRTWRPAVAYVGAQGLPDVLQAGNVLRPETVLKLSIRTPPTLDALEAEKKIGELLTRNPPYGAQVTWESDGGAAGWKAPDIEPWLQTALDTASRTHFGKPTADMGEGGSIPFMGMLHAKFPKAQFVVTGVLGPYSNAHGPNEFLDIPMVKKLTACIADVIAATASK